MGVKLQKGKKVISKLGLPFIVPELIYKFQMVCLWGTYVIEQNLWGTYVIEQKSNTRHTDISKT